MASYADDKHDIVTIFGRKSTQPLLDENGQKVEAVDIPKMIYFILPDGQAVEVDAVDEIVIGRQPTKQDPAVSVDLQGYEGHRMGVSRYHAMIKQVNGILMICDLSSINGTLINGKMAEPLKRYVLRDGDAITVGRITIQLKFYL